MKKILFFGLLLSIASITFAQRQMQVWQNGVPTNFAVAEVDSITFMHSYNSALIGEWCKTTNENYIVVISDSLIEIPIEQRICKYTASESQLYIERLWTMEDAPHRWEYCDYLLVGDTLKIDNFDEVWLSVYPPKFTDIKLIRMKR